jgi:autotransporter-associated beta strand protein
LQVGIGGSIGSLGSGGVTDNSSLVFDRSDAGFTVANNISGTGTVTQSGAGTTTLTGNNSYSGGTTIQAGTLAIGAAGALPSGGNVANNAAFKVNANSAAGNVSGTGATTVASSVTFSAVNFSQAGGLVNNGTTTITGNGTVGPISGTGSLVVGSGSSSNTLNLAASSGASSQSAITVQSGAAFSVATGGNTLTASTLTVQSGAKANMGGGNNLLTINAATANAIQILGSGQLNVNGEMIINYQPGQDPITTIQQYLTSGYNNGAWNGPGLMSSDAQTLNNGLAYALGVADYAQAPGFVAGLTSNQIEVKYTLVGDLDLNSFVNGIDFARLATHFNDFDTNWVDGNVIYGSSIVNGVDFSQLAKNFGHIATTGASVTLSAADWAAFDAFEANEGVGGAVPEPTTMGLLAIGGLGLMRRRRRKPLRLGM